MREKITKRNQQTGFTIIEVVLVLAIAGLIFLIVFLALPQLQRSRRDTQRKSDAGRLTTALETYAGNHNGDYPDDSDEVGSEIVGKYIGGSIDVWTDPSTGEDYTVSNNSAVPAEGEMTYAVGEDCDGNDGVGARTFAVKVFQESGGEYCQDNR